VILFGIDVIPLGIVSAVLVVLQGTIVGSWCVLWDVFWGRRVEAADAVALQRSA
jgi:hypothetical protein